MKKKIIVTVGILFAIGIVSQVVERTMDRDSIKDFVVTNFKETDDDATNFDFKDEKETNFIEWLGF